MTVFTKPEYAPAREPILKRLKAVIDGRIKIQEGMGTDDEENIERMGKGFHPISLCIMEATAYILGYDNVSDDPPCTSQAIKELMINLNDAVSDRQRGLMKKVIPDIINTAPTVWVKDTKSGCLKGPDKKCLKDEQGNKVYPEKLATNERDKDYSAAETTRHEMIEAFVEAQPKQKDQYGDMQTREYDQIPMSKWLPLIQELAAVAKFDHRNGETEKDMDTPAVEPESVQQDNPGGIAGGVLDGTYDPGGPPQTEG